MKECIKEVESSTKEHIEITAGVIIVARKPVEVNFIKEILPKIAEIIKNQSISKIILEHNNLIYDDTKALLELLREHGKAKNAGKNSSGHDHQILVLAIEKGMIQLTNKPAEINFIKEILPEIEKTINKNIIVRIELVESHLTDEDVIALAELLKVNENAKYIGAATLSKNNISEVGITAMLHLTASNKSLQILDLQFNNITPNSEFFSALFTNAAVHKIYTYGNKFTDEDKTKLTKYCDYNKAIEGKELGFIDILRCKAVFNKNLEQINDTEQSSDVKPRHKALNLKGDLFTSGSSWLSRTIREYVGPEKISLR